MGLLPGWWLGEEKVRASSPCFTEAQWNSALLKEGFSGIDISLKDFEDDACHEMSVFISTAVRLLRANPPIETLPGTTSLNKIYLVAESDSAVQLALTRQIQTSCESIESLSCKTITLSQVGSQSDIPESIFIFLQELERPLLRDISSEDFTSLQRILTAPSRSLWLSRGGGTSLQSADYSTVDGLARSARAENNELVFVTIAFDMRETMNLTSQQLQNFRKIFDATMTVVDGKVCEPAFVEMNGLLNIGRVDVAYELTEKVRLLLPSQVFGCIANDN